ncbi:MAG: hypothetical protein GW913_00880 [Myxococcales bacterium]|nr:hypothetical protein [Myxococcales bacterium]
MGTQGCGFEQHLEAMLKAVTPSTSSTTFVAGTRGHADVENAGFLRSDSVLGVIVLANEDDCSASDPDLYNQSSARYVGSLGLRCYRFPEAVYPVSRYVSGLIALRPGHPGRVVFGAIAGVPPDLVDDPRAIDYGEILADPRMVLIPDETMPTRLTPSCNVPAPGLGLAFPPVRFTQVARDLQGAGAHAIVQSLCQEDFTPAIDAILGVLFDALDGVCGR